MGRYPIDNGTLHRAASFAEMMMLHAAVAVADVCNIWRRCGCIEPILGCSRMMNRIRRGVQNNTVLGLFVLKSTTQVNIIQEYHFKVQTIFSC